MTSLADIARLNVLIELFSECASCADLPTLLRVAAGRLRWVLEFDRCLLTTLGPHGRECWLGTPAHDNLRAVALGELPENERSLIERVLATGAPAARAPGTVCVPLEAAGQTVGALCVSSTSASTTTVPWRLAHPAGQYLGSLISRMNLEDETRALSARKDDLLALLGHELRNPLAPIVTAVELLKLRGDAPSKELDVIERQARHLVRLVDDLLDVARLTRGKMTLERAPIDIAEIVSVAVEMVEPLLDERRHSLTVDVPLGLVVSGDAHRLVQVLSNLLTNAAHYTAAGGRVDVTAGVAGDSVVVDVADNGIGIEGSAFAEIFDLFVQGSDARTIRPGGLGLGLVIVKQLTELHGGSATVASAGSNGGTKFTIRLPHLVGGVPAAATVPHAPGARAEGALSILVVDDNEDALDLRSAFLRASGHDVVTAHDGAAALEVLHTATPAVALIDINMPGMDGYELAARIRSGSRSPQPRLLALTGYGQPSDRERTRLAGFDEHLVKPVDVTHLLRTLAHAASDAV